MHNPHPDLPRGGRLSRFAPGIRVDHRDGAFFVGKRWRLGCGNTIFTRTENNFVNRLIAEAVVVSDSVVIDLKLLMAELGNPNVSFV